MPNLRLVYRAPTPVSALQFETVARLRVRVLRRACFPSQLACAEYYRVGLRSVAGWESGRSRIPGWLVVALEQRARELGVVIVDQPRKAA